MSIIIETLKKKLIEIQSKRNKLWNELQRNHIQEIIEIRKGFKEVLAKYGGLSEEAKNYAFKYADKEKELFKQAKYVNEHNNEMLDQVLKYDNEIYKLSNEIGCQEMRK